MVRSLSFSRAVSTGRHQTKFYSRYCTILNGVSLPFTRVQPRHTWFDIYLTFPGLKSHEFASVLRVGAAGVAKYACVMAQLKCFIVTIVYFKDILARLGYCLCTVCLSAGACRCLVMERRPTSFIKMEFTFWST